METIEPLRQEIRDWAQDGRDREPQSLAVTKDSPPDAKIKLFRSLFRGREDVYPRGFENRKTGKAGYAPACANEWIRGVCEKPRIKCVDCPNRRFYQITDEVVGWHLSGRDVQRREFVIGVYAMLFDETRFFPAGGLHPGKMRQEAGAFLPNPPPLPSPPPPGPFPGRHRRPS